MDYLAIADVLRRLLVMYPGVSIDHLRTHPSGYATVSLRISQPASLARLACCAAGAKVAFFVWADSAGSNEEQWASPDRVRYELRASADPVTTALPSTAQLLCAHMLPQLVDLGCLDQTEADRLSEDLLADFKPGGGADCSDDRTAEA
jgi:hypothetical protein